MHEHSPSAARALHLWWVVRTLTYRFSSDALGANGDVSPAHACGMDAFFFGGSCTVCSSSSSSHQRVACVQFLPGHACYDPPFWLEHAIPYEVQYRNPCEPYTIGLRDALPAFDRRFRGRIRDKVRLHLPSAFTLRRLTRRLRRPGVPPPCETCDAMLEARFSSPDQSFRGDRVHASCVCCMHAGLHPHTHGRLGHPLHCRP